MRSSLALSDHWNNWIVGEKRSRSENLSEWDQSLYWSQTYLSAVFSFCAYCSAPARTSVNHICETTEDSPHANTVRGHHIDQFDLDTGEQVGDTLLQRDTIETLPDQPVEVVADLHLDPYYGAAARQKLSTLRWLSVERLHFTHMRHCTHVCAQQTLSLLWRRLLVSHSTESRILFRASSPGFR